MIQVFVTGGTFDKEYNLLTGKLYFRNTHLSEMFERGRCAIDLDIKTLMMIDSLELSDTDREIIAYNCKKSANDRIIVTHGTDTMVQTARVIADSGIENKTIVLTGALIPATFGTSSDGFFNLGSALAFVQSLPYGIYIGMNGRFFNWDNVVKNTKTGFFEELDD